MSTLNCTVGTWAGPPDSYTYQWQRSPDGATWLNIPGATSSSYSTVLVDEGSYVACLVTGTNLIGSTTARSNSILVQDRIADFRLRIGWSGGIAHRLHFSDTDPFFSSDDVFATQWTEYFNGVYDDVTDDVAEGSQIIWSRGTDSQAAAAEAGQSSFALLNAETPALYDPNDPSSPLYPGGSVSPGFVPVRPIWLEGSSDGGVTWKGLFYHFIAEADYDPSTYTCTITGGDLIWWMNRCKNPVIPTQTGISSAAAVMVLLEAIGFTDPAFIQVTSTPAIQSMDFGNPDGSQSAISLLAGILDAEQGHVYVDGNGVFHFEDRYQRDRRQTATASFESAIVGLASKVSADLIRNRVTVTPATGDPQVAEDVDSETTYGIGDFADISTDYIPDDARALQLAQLLLLRYGGNRPPTQPILDNDSNATTAALLGLEVEQRITVDGVDGFVERLDCTLDAGGTHLQVSPLLTEAPDTHALMFGSTSVFGTADYFG